MGRPTVLVVGDSLSAEYGIRRDTGWVSYIARNLQNNSEKYLVENISISGDTSSGGLSRLPQALEQYQPAIVIIELGSNDALRGLPLDMTKNNLAQMIQLAHESNAKVLLIGMQLPPNYGRQYTTQFIQMFENLAQEYNTALLPFLFNGFATDQEYFQEDGIHPNEKAQELMANNIWEQLKTLLPDL